MTYNVSTFKLQYCLPINVSGNFPQEIKYRNKYDFPLKHSYMGSNKTAYYCYRESHIALENAWCEVMFRLFAPL